MITLQFSYTLADVEEAYGEARRRKWKSHAARRRVIIALLLVCMVLLFWLDPNSSAAWTLVGALFVIGFSYGIAWAAWGRLAKRNWNSTPVFRQRFKIEINETGVSTDCEIAKSFRSWECATSFHESPKLFTIQYGEAQSLWFPQRAMTAAQIEELRALLKSKVPSTT